MFAAACSREQRNGSGPDVEQLGEGSSHCCHDDAADVSSAVHMRQMSSHRWRSREGHRTVARDGQLEGRTWLHRQVGEQTFVVPMALMSRLTQSIHLCFGLPLLLLPGGTISRVFLPTYSWSRLFIQLVFGIF